MGCPGDNLQLEKPSLEAGGGGQGAGGGGRRLPLDRQEVLHPKAVIRVLQKIKWPERVRQLKGCRCEEPSGVWLSQN